MARHSPSRVTSALVALIVIAAITVAVHHAALGHRLDTGPVLRPPAVNSRPALRAIADVLPKVAEPVVKSKAEGQSNKGRTVGGSGVRKGMPATDGIDEVALRQAAPDGTLVVIPVNDGYIDFGLNLLCSLRALGVIPASLRGFVFVAMDALALSKLTAMQLPVVKDPDVPFVSSNATGWGHESFHKLVCTKLIPVIRFLKLGLNVVLSDADIVFQSDPRPFFRKDLDMTFSIGSCHKDLPDNYDFASGDGVAKLNTGFYVARNTKGVLSLMTRALENCRSSQLTGDQPAINSVLHSDLTASKSEGAGARSGQRYSYGFFDGCLFANGCIYFKHLCANTSIADPRPGIARGDPSREKVRANKLEPGKPIPPGHIRRDDPVMVHANFLVGKKEKVKHLTKYGLWNATCIETWRRVGL